MRAAVQHLDSVQVEECCQPVLLHRYWTMFWSIHSSFKIAMVTESSVHDAVHFRESYNALDFAMTSILKIYTEQELKNASDYLNLQIIESSVLSKTGKDPSVDKLFCNLTKSWSRYNKGYQIAKAIIETLPHG